MNKLSLFLVISITTLISAEIDDALEILNEQTLSDVDKKDETKAKIEKQKPDIDEKKAEIISAEIVDFKEDSIIDKDEIAQDILESLSQAKDKALSLAQKTVEYAAKTEAIAKEVKISANNTMKHLLSGNTIAAKESAEAAKKLAKSAKEAADKTRRKTYKTYEKIRNLKSIEIEKSKDLEKKFQIDLDNDFDDNDFDDFNDNY